METPKFKELLFSTAICAMACDGEIHTQEVVELQSMIQSTPYFSGVDGNNMLDNQITEIKRDGIRAIERYFERLRAIELNSSQELLLLEVVLRIIHADHKLEDNEKRFVSIIRRGLKLHDEIITSRFGYHSYLVLNRSAAVGIVRTEAESGVVSLESFELLNDADTQFTDTGSFETNSP